MSASIYIRLFYAVGLDGNKRRESPHHKKRKLNIKLHTLYCLRRERAFDKVGAGTLTSCRQGER